MAYGIQGETGQLAKVIVFDETDFSVIETHDTISGSFDMAVVSGTKTVLARRISDGEAYGYGLVTPVLTGAAFEDNFDTYDTNTWTSSRVAPTATAGILTWYPSSNYGESYTYDLRTETGVSHSDFKITCRCRCITGAAKSYGSWGLRYDGIGFRQYLQGSTSMKFLNGSTEFEVNGTNHGIQSACYGQWQLQTVNFKDATLTVTIEYEEPAYQSYNLNRSNALTDTPSNNGDLRIGIGRGGVHWEIDYLKLDPAD